MHYAYAIFVKKFNRSRITLVNRRKRESRDFWSNTTTTTIIICLPTITLHKNGTKNIHYSFVSILRLDYTTE